MILQTLSETEFRNDKAAVKALRDFLLTDAGEKFAAVLRGADPLDVLATDHNTDPAKIRDLSLAEKANPDNLLGMAKGHRMVINLIDRCTEELTPAGAAKLPPSAGERAREVMSKTAVD